jgi:hypothetical protein
MPHRIFHNLLGPQMGQLSFGPVEPQVRLCNLSMSDEAT